jgi:hypothetical protein
MEPGGDSPPVLEKVSSSLGGTCDEYGFIVAEENVVAYKEHSRLQAERRLICEQAGCLV